jgi:hypothetical protein
MSDHSGTEPTSLALGIDGEIVDPSAMAIVADHDRRYDHSEFILAHEHFAVAGALAKGDVGSGVVVWDDEIARAPECFHALKVIVPILADAHPAG